MSDAFLPGNGFDTYEAQDKVLVQMNGSRESGVAVRILQQQGFAVVGAVVRLAAEEAEAAAAAKQAVMPGLPPCSQPPTSWASNTSPPATTPGWNWAVTAFTPFARASMRTVTRAPGWRLCRRKRWHG